MKTPELLRRRLYNQQLIDARARTPGEVVTSLVAMQAQEYAMAKWAIALRLARATNDAQIERAFNAGEILRTHALRPTWHFVAPADIRWLLALTAPRVHAANAYMYRQLDLDASVFKRSNAALARAFQDERYLTRSALQTVLAKSGVKASGPRLGYLMMNAELDGLICSGPREGKQFTYGLLDGRVPAAKAITRDAALAQLSRRYFASRGPATAQDFATWSGLTLNDARAGIDSLGPEFVRETSGASALVYRADDSPKASRACFAFLMPDYDEYGMSYKDRSALLPPAQAGRKSKGITLAYNRMIVVDGQIVGSWRRGPTGIETVYLAPPGPKPLRAIAHALDRFTTFTGC